MERAAGQALAVPQRPQAAAQAPAPQGARLSAARRALALAEERVGLSSGGALEVQRALRAPSRDPESCRDPWSRLRAGGAGAVSISGSTTLLLAALAMHQGAHGWCAVLGGEDLGWCAAHELGIDLSRVLIAPTAGLEPAAILAAATALLDGVGGLLIDRRAATALRPRHRRHLAARARERRATILTDAPWEEALTLEASRIDPEGDRPDAARVVPLRPHCPPPSAREMTAGHLRRLAWSLADPRPGRGSSTLVLDDEGLTRAALARAPADPAELTEAPAEPQGLEGAG
ncbi:hypothetical protein [Actinomyces bowdenii]|uniref:hypothetical protein n=1 Tax=Actinomyces bowdenii TaxID=131109 RepID=UPI001FD209F4|nr:hypothetical protein [Actinomyces bowdenii]